MYFTGKLIYFTGKVNMSEEDTVCSGVSALIVKVARLNRLGAEGALRDVGIRAGQELVMGCLWEQDGLRPGSIADALGVTPALVTKHIRNLTKSGFLNQRADVSDGRATRIYLTNKGKNAQSTVAEKIRTLEAQLLSGLSNSEKKQFLSFLRTISSPTNRNSS